jgi:hypothetical protein
MGRAVRTLHYVLLSRNTAARCCRREGEPPGRRRKALKTAFAASTAAIRNDRSKSIVDTQSVTADVING